jgi:SAM-dependent methyltransferase
MQPCRTCGSISLKRVGTLPDTNSFAGRLLPTQLQGGALWHCSNCGFAFRHPHLGEASYVDLYQNGSLNVWDGEQQRVDFKLVRDYLNSYSTENSTVVDIGCYTGRLLVSLPYNLRRFGVEPNVAAAQIAASRDITILARTIDEFAGMDGSYDFIVACDVIEHVENPLQFLRRLGLHLAPRGRLLVTTGNYDSWLWRMTGAKYWYCYFPEHISFIGPTWLGRIQDKVGLKLCKVIPFNYAGGRFNIKLTLASLLYALNPRLFRRIRRHSINKGERVAETPPGCGAIRDHMLCIFEPASSTPI